MKLCIVHDRDGRILAASILDAESDDGLTIRPIATDPEHTLVELDASGESGDLAEICSRMRVDPERKQLVPNDDKGS